jgi:hypothetical protein
MQDRWLWAVAVVVWLGGCAPERDQPSLPSASLAPAVPPAAKKSPPAAVEKSAARSAEKQSAAPKVDSFGLPLVIEIKVPEAPPEIQKPSPPIKEEPEKSSKSWWNVF